MKRWYVVYTQANNERRAQLNLLRQGFDAYLPLLKKVRQHARRSETVLRPLFPRYLFVRLDLSKERWRSILSTYGVSQLVCNAAVPAPVPDGIVEAIQELGDGIGTVHPLRLRTSVAGEPIRVESGVFAQQLAQVKELADHDRVTILTRMLGCDVTVKLPLEAVTIL